MKTLILLASMLATFSWTVILTDDPTPSDCVDVGDARRCELVLP